MKISIDKERIYYFLLIMCLLFQNRFFHCVDASMTLTMGLMICVMMSFFVAFQDRYHTECRSLYQYILSVIIVVVVPQTVYAFYLGETMDGYIDTMRGLLTILLVVPVLKLFLRQHGMKKVLDLISFVTAITLGLILMNSFALNNYGLQLLPFKYYEMPLTGRWGRLRLYLISDFTALVSIYSVCRFLDKRTQKLRYLIYFTICLSASIYVEQSRMQYMAIIASSIIAYSRTLKTNKVFLYFAAGVFAVFGLAGDWFSGFINTFSVSNADLGISTLIRINEYKHAFELILKHPILGTGMTADYLFNTTLNGFSFVYNHTDIGLLGCISYIGFGGTLILFLIPYVRMIRTLFLIPRSGEGTFEHCFLSGLIVFIGITSLTILITDSARIFVWPFILAVNEYIRYIWIAQLNSEVSTYD